MTSSPLPKVRQSAQRRQAAQPFAELLWAFEHRRHHQTVEHLRRARRLLTLGFGNSQHRRRAEDLIRDERHDARAVTIKGSQIN